MIYSIFDQTISHFPELMIDPFGNYLCQKLMEVCGSAKLREVVEIVLDFIVPIALNPYGTRAIQTLIEVSHNTHFIIPITSTLQDHVVLLIKDINGNHVIQRCLNVLHPPHDEFIYKAACSNVIEIATHRHGCCVL